MRNPRVLQEGRRRLRLVAAGLAILSGWAFAGAAVAADEATLAAAKEEGAVVFYSAAPADVLDNLAKAFSEEYPDIEAQYYRGTTAQVFSRVQAEITAGRHEADIIHVSDPAQINEMKAAGALVAYDSPEYANYPADYIDPDRTWFVARGHLLLIGYNPTLLTGDDVPKSWADLAKPNLKGRVGIMDVRNTGGAYYWQYTVWKTLGPDYFAAMAANQPVTADGHAALNDRVISGELAAGVDLNYLVDESSIEKKAPVKAVYPSEGSALILSPVGIVNNSPHPNAAKVFIDFLASAKGQAIFNNTYTYSLRNDAVPREGMTPLKDINVLHFSNDELVQNQKTVQAAARGAFGIQ